MGDKAAERELQRLRKLPENKVCPNCSRKENHFGFSAVCWQFKTFVCGECKSAHQSFSHRCKSVTMSNWTLDEVRQLDERSGGGNRLAMERWVEGAPDSLKPNSGTSLEALKRFIDRAYNQKEWEGSSSRPRRRDDQEGDGGRRRRDGPEIDGGRRREEGLSTRTDQGGPQRRGGGEGGGGGGGRMPKPSFAPQNAGPSAAPVSAPAQSANLLDMMDEPTASVGGGGAAWATAAGQAAPAADLNFDPFGLSTSAAPAAMTAAANQPAGTLDLFAGSSGPSLGGGPSGQAGDDNFDVFQMATPAGNTQSVCQPSPMQQQSCQAFGIAPSAQQQGFQAMQSSQPVSSMASNGGVANGSRSSAFGFLSGGACAGGGMMQQTGNCGMMPQATGWSALAQPSQQQGYAALGGAAAGMQCGGGIGTSHPMQRMQPGFQPGFQQASGGYNQQQQGMQGMMPQQQQQGVPHGMQQSGQQQMQNPGMFQQNSQQQQAAPSQAASTNKKESTEVFDPFAPTVSVR